MTTSIGQNANWNMNNEVNMKILKVSQNWACLLIDAHTFSVVQTSYATISFFPNTVCRDIDNNNLSYL